MANAYSILDRCYQEKNYLALACLEQYLYQIADKADSLQEKKPDSWLKELEHKIEELRRQAKYMPEQEESEFNELIYFVSEDHEPMLSEFRAGCSRKIGAENLKAIEDYLGLHNLSNQGIILMNYNAFKEFFDAVTEYRYRLEDEIGPDVTTVESDSITCSR
jgi:hypothetical protein